MQQANEFVLLIVIRNFIILELSPWNFHNEIPCYWVKFHAIINFTREAQVITYLCTYLCVYYIAYVPYVLFTMELPVKVPESSMKVPLKVSQGV